MTAQIRQPSREMTDIQRRALRRRSINRGLTYVVAILVALWIIVPIYLIGSLAFSSVEGVRAYPKTVFPFTPVSTETFEFFLNTTGILPSFVGNSVPA